MADEYRVLVTKRAAENLESIFDFISQDSPQNASTMISKLMDSIDRLGMFPYRYAVPRVAPGRNKSIRTMPVWPFLVKYRIDERKKGGLRLDRAAWRTAAPLISSRLKTCGKCHYGITRASGYCAARRSLSCSA